MTDDTASFTWGEDPERVGGGQPRIQPATRGNGWFGQPDDAGPLRRGSLSCVMALALLGAAAVFFALTYVLVLASCSDGCGSREEGVLDVAATFAMLVVVPAVHLMVSALHPQAVRAAGLRVLLLPTVSSVVLLAVHERLTTATAAELPAALAALAVWALLSHDLLRLWAAAWHKGGPEGRKALAIALTGPTLIIALNLALNA